ncbi:MAG: cytochrome c family protein [Hyphomonadaceae bacterium]
MSPEQIAAGLAELPPPYNEGDYEAGRRIFMQCSSCHLIADSPNRKSGPNLHGVYGAVSGHRENFNYSPAMRNAGLTWDAPTLDRYLENPRAAVPGTIMAFVGVRDPEQRRDLVAYLAIESKR